MAGLSAFSTAYFGSDTEHVDEYETVEARRIRYAVFWAMYANTAYERIHSFATALKHQYSTYKHIRSLYNPSLRLGSFYAAHLWGGALDPDAGEEGAIPIETEFDALRLTIATLWKATNFGTLKDVLTLRGCIEGDLILAVHDDVEKKRVYLERLDPGIVTELDLDTIGNVKGYILEEQRPHPEHPAQNVAYKLVVSRDGENVVYETSLNDKPYGWDEQPARWEEPYTFVPLVLIKHVDVGLEWGWSELHPLRSKIREVDDLASMLSDQIRKYLEPIWLMPGTKQDLSIGGGQANETGSANTRPSPGREELKAIWNWPPEAKASALITDLNLMGALTHLDNLLAELERDCPELQQDIWATGATSGKALRVARQRVEARAIQRRANYDVGLVKIQMMALSIGGFRDYPGYEGIDLASYAAGDLDHRIADRPVFTPDPMDAIEISSALWTAASVAVGAGADLAGFLRAAGWSKEQIADVVFTPVLPEPEPDEDLTPPEIEGEGEEDGESTEPTD